MMHDGRSGVFLFCYEIRSDDFRRPALDVPDGVDEIFVEVGLMRDEQQRALVLLQCALELLLGLDVEVVRRLVEHEQIDRLLHDLGQADLSRLAA